MLIVSILVLPFPFLKLYFIVYVTIRVMNLVANLTGG